MQEKIINAVADILNDVALATRTRKDDLISECLIKYYLPKHDYVKNVIVEMYSGKISLNMAYAKILSYAKKHCEADMEYIMLLTISLQRLFSQQIYIEDDDKEWEYFSSVILPTLDSAFVKKIKLNQDMHIIHIHEILDIVLTDWEKYEQNRNMYKFLAFCCTHDKPWCNTPMDRFIFYNQLIGVADKLEIKERKAGEYIEESDCL